MLETINDFGRKVTALYEAGQYCTFAPPEDTLGFIDTSPAHDGSRGIAFLCDEIRTDFGGIISRVGYRQVCSVSIVKSYETTFDDELEIEASGCCIRITDCSLNKFFLKQLINSMCRIYYTMTEEQRNEMHSVCTAAAAEHFAGEIPAVEVQIPAAPVTLPAPPCIAEPVPAAIPEGRIHWLSGGDGDDYLKTADACEADGAAPSESDEDDLLSPDNELPQDMSRDEALSYLINTISEINSDDDEQESGENLQTSGNSPQADTELAAEKEPVLQLTEEPQSDDIYIKASRRLRGFCERRLLTMEQIEAEVKQSMVTVAESYSALCAGGGIPAAIEQRVHTLKSASERLTDYFALGEDIAARVMFFMLYQMLSYSDRIAEQPQTKERLNDFFRRYGSAGMALSLLDSGI